MPGHLDKVSCLVGCKVMFFAQALVLVKYGTSICFDYYAEAAGESSIFSRLVEYV